jgi:hypothetical protein
LKSKITICAPNWLPLRHSCKKWEQRSVVSWECEDEIAYVLSIKCLLVLKKCMQGSLDFLRVIQRWLLL